MLEKILRWSGITTAVSAIVMAVMGFFVVTFLGPGLAMGISIYSGYTEPIQPKAEAPWIVFLPITISVVSLFFQSRHPLIPWLAFVLALFAAAMEFSYLLELVALAKQ